MTLEEVPGVLLLMALAGEAPEQLEALEWTARECPQYLEDLGYPQNGQGIWAFWPNESGTWIRRFNDWLALRESKGLKRYAKYARYFL